MSASCQNGTAAPPIHVLDQLLGEPPHDRLDDERTGALTLNVFDRLRRSADAVAFGGFQCDQHRELEPFLPEDRRQLPRLAPRLPLVAGVERERDERETRE